MRFHTEASDGNLSLHSLYEQFIAYANTTDAYVGNTVTALLVIAITAAALGIIVLFMRRKDQQRQAAFEKERDMSTVEITYVGSSYASDKSNTTFFYTSDASDATFMVTFFIAAIALVAVNIFGIPWLDSPKDREVQQTEIVQQIEETAHRHIREDYTVAEVKTIDTPHDSAGKREYQTYQEDMQQWAKDFYRANGHPLTVEVQLEDEPSTVYTYRLWYNHQDDRAELLNHHSNAQERDTAPEVDSLKREDS